MPEPLFFGGRYELGEILGQGGMAEVRIGIDRRLGRTVAVKILRSDLATDPTFQARFRREAQSAASLNHPAIVAVYDTGEEIINQTNVPYIVMEYVEGRTLRDVLREGRRILPERALEITADVLEALEYSHRAGIVHRDIKPGNVMLTPRGEVKVMDFGIARAVADAAGTMTQTAAVIGTAQYLSPEQARGESVDARSDIYSTGCMLYELLTGRPPFVGDSPVSVAYQHVREEARPPSMLDPEVTPEADAICLKALSKKPLDRYQSADEMRGDLVRALSGQRVSAPVMPMDATSRFMPADDAPPMPPAQEQYGQWDDSEDERAKKRRRAAWITVAVAAVILFAVIGYLLWQVFAPTSTITVPSLVNRTEEQAVAAIEGRGLQPRIDREPDANVAAGTVIRQSPDPGTSVEADSFVEIVVSLGEPQTAIPTGLVGMDVDAAEDALREAGLTQVRREPDEGSDAPANEVIAVTPEEGTEVAEDTPVTLTYSEGLVEVPEVRQQPEADARRILGEAGFADVDVVREDSDTEQGRVFRQEPAANERVAPGTTVTIYLPTEIQPPDLAVSATASELVTPGGPAQIDVTIRNDGAGETTEPFSVRITIPEGVELAGTVQDGCDTDGRTVTCNLADFAPGADQTLRLDVIIGFEAQPGDTLEGQAEVASNEDGNGDNNSATYQMRVP